MREETVQASEIKKHLLLCRSGLGRDRPSDCQAKQALCGTPMPVVERFQFGLHVWYTDLKQANSQISNGRLLKVRLPYRRVVAATGWFLKQFLLCP